MTTVYKFKAYFTDAGVGTAQDPAPTCTVINMADDSKLADAQATTASTNMPGLYSYEYSGNDGLDCVAFFATSDTGCDVKQLASYVSEKITIMSKGVSIASAQTVATVTDVTNAVKISAGTGAGQLDFTSGVVKSNLSQILGTALTETAGLIAAGFKKFFNVATPTGTVNSLPDAAPAANGGLPTTNGTKVNQTVDLTAGQSIAANGGTVTTLTNLPAITANWLTGTGIDTTAVTELQAGLALEATLTAIKGAGWTTETLVAIDVLIDAIKAKTDTIGDLALKADLQDVEDKIDVIATDTTTEIPAAIAGIPAAVWGYATRTLSSFGTLVADIWSYVNRTLSAFGFTVATNSDANVTAIKAKTDVLPASPAPASEYDARMAAIQADLDNPAQYKADVSAITGAALSAAGVDAILDEVVVGTYTMRQLLALFAAKLHGTAAGGNTDTITYDSLDGTTTSVIVETVDEDGNRTVVLTV